MIFLKQRRHRENCSDTRYSNRPFGEKRDVKCAGECECGSVLDFEFE